MKPAVFLDRDGTINEEVGYIRDLDHLKLISGAASAIAKLNRAGIPAVLVTNQSGPARGYYDEAWVRTLLDRLSALLHEEAGATLDARYYCPHLPPDEGGVVEGYARHCSCRKPATGMILQAAREHDLDVPRSFVVGDKASDILLGHNAKARTVLLETGYGRDVLAGRYQFPIRPDHVAAHLDDAVDWILDEIARPALA